MRKKTAVMNEEIGLPVYHGNELHFNDFLRQQIGAGWYAVKEMLYEYGFEAGAVYEYREKLLKEFRAICRKYGYVPVLYK